MLLLPNMGQNLILLILTNVIKEENRTIRLSPLRYPSSRCEVEFRSKKEHNPRTSHVEKVIERENKREKERLRCKDWVGKGE